MIDCAGSRDLSARGEQMADRRQPAHASHAECLQEPTTTGKEQTGANADASVVP